MISAKNFTAILFASFLLQAIQTSIVKHYGAQPPSAKNYTDLYGYKKGASRRIYHSEALQCPYKINANDPRPKWATTGLLRLLRHLTVSRNDNTLCRNTQNAPQSCSGINVFTWVFALLSCTWNLQISEREQELNSLICRYKYTFKQVKKNGFSWEILQKASK